RSSSATVFLAWEWLRPWWRHFRREDDELCILAASDCGLTIADCGLANPKSEIRNPKSGRLVGLAPLYRSRVRASYGLGSLRRAGFIGDRSGDSEYLDFIIEPGREEEVLRAFLDRIEGWDLAQFWLVPESSPNLAVLRRIAAERRWLAEEKRWPCLAIQLPGDWESYLATLQPRFRSKLRSLLRRLPGGTGSQVSGGTGVPPVAVFDQCTDPAELPERLESLFALHQARWRAAGKPGSFADPARRGFYREMAEGLLRRGWLRFHSLRLGPPGHRPEARATNHRPEACATKQRPEGCATINDHEVAQASRLWVAHEFSFEHLGRVYFLQQAFDAARADLNAGTALKAHAIRESIARGAREYDFLGGDAPYKQKWGAQRRECVFLTLARRTAKARLHMALPRLRDAARALTPGPLLRLKRRVQHWLRRPSESPHAEEDERAEKSEARAEIRNPKSEIRNALRVALVNRFFHRAGAVPTVVREWADHLEAAGHEVVVFASDVDPAGNTDRRTYVPVPMGGARHRPEACATSVPTAPEACATSVPTAPEACATSVPGAVAQASRLWRAFDLAGLAFAWRLRRRISDFGFRISDFNPQSAIRNPQFDLLLCTDSTAYFGAWRACRRLGVPAIMAFQGWVYSPGKRGLYPRTVTWVYKLAVHFCVRRAPLIACISREIYDGFRGLGVPQERLWLAPNCVDLSAWDTGKAGAHRRAERRLLFVGRFSPEKGLRYLLEALPSVVARFPQVEALLVGTDEPDGGEFHQLARGLGVADSVRFGGVVPREALKELYADADLLVVPSLAEGHPLAPVEALACGTPVVGSDIPGLNETVADGVNGLLVPPRDPAALAEALCRALGDAELLDRLSRAARPSVERFAWEPRVRELAEVYSRLVTSTRGG
ncbi:MAG: GNAT family N-acetyltransferase, partial [Planctomycetes bacterium]|nr:GNAT family N-acetyltransferase [Planctomycetota bacterium]